MIPADWLHLILFIGLLVVLTPVVGNYMAKLYQGKLTYLAPLESAFYRLSNIDAKEEQSWIKYVKALLYFNLLGLIVLFLIQVLQGYLPLNPQKFPGVESFLAFNTAASFVTNTNWQAYTGEATLSYFTQAAGLTVQNFLSAATGLTALIAFIRGIVAKSTEGLGNFWVDLVRTVLYLLLPLSLIFAVILVSQGTCQTVSPYVEVTTLEGQKQTIPLGPVASQIAIKQLGTNGGGFFNANSAHPFENPNGLSNFLETLALVLIPAASVYMYGVMIEKKRHAWLLFGVMFTLWFIGFILAAYSEHLVNPVLAANPVLEGKETRFGTFFSFLWSTFTTASANGSVNAMISSLSPLAGAVSLFNIMLGEIVFGGVGVGLAGMLMYVLLTVFLSGLMVGRTPEYLGKKIEKRDVQWIIISILTPGALILIGASCAFSLSGALASLANSGPHGLTEIVYAFTSAAGNNGSAFAGLNANTAFYNIALGIVMILARLAILVPSLAVAGLLSKKKIAQASSGTFSTECFLFAALLFGVILIVGALTFFPALSLGPIVEHVLMLHGVSI